MGGGNSDVPNCPEANAFNVAIAHILLKNN